MTEHYMQFGVCATIVDTNYGSWFGCEDDKIASSYYWIHESDLELLND